MRWVLVGALLLSWPECGSSDDSDGRSRPDASPSDAGTDVSVDAAPDTEPDALPEAGPDGGGGASYAWTDISPPGGFVSAVAFDPHHAGRLWASGDDASGLYRRQDTAPFELVTSAPIDWSTYSFAFDPDTPGTIYAPNHFGRGLAKSADDGASWQVVGTGLPTGPDDKVLYDLWVAPSDPTVLVAATAGGLHRSTDGGATFSGVDSPVFTHGKAFSSLCGNASALYAGNDKGGVFASTDTGETWQAIATPDPAGVRVSDMAATSSALYVAYDFGFLARTESFSASDYTPINDPTAGGTIASGMWTRIAAVSGASAASDRLYVGTVATTSGGSFGFFASDDGGQSFEPRMAGIEGTSAFSIAVDPTDHDRVVFATINHGVFETMDGGTSWSDISAGVSATDSFGFAEDPADPDHLLFSSTAGLPGTSRMFETHDAGDTWSEVDSLDQADVMSLYVDEADPSKLMAGTFREGILRTTQGSGGPWVEVLSCACSIREIVPDASSKTLYAITDEMVAPSDPGDVGLWVSVDQGQSWEQRANIRVLDIKPVPGPGDRMVAVGADVYVSEDAFLSKRDLGLASFAPAGAVFTSVAVHPEEPDTLLVGTSEGELFRTTDAGADPVVWEELDTPAQRALVLDLAIVPEAGWFASCWVGDVVYEPGYTAGIMRSSDGGETWEFLDEGLYPSTLVWKMLPSRHQPGRLFAGMWGGGFLRLDVDAGST